MRGNLWSRLGLAAGVTAVTFLSGVPAWSKGWSKGPKDGVPALWIAADRVVGFVPFTVALYGKVRSATEPSRLELCREVATQVDLADSRSGQDERMQPARHEPDPAAAEPSCATGTLVRTPDGYDYQHEIRFDRPGTYRVRLSMVDQGGHRVISNTVQVNAL